MEKRGTRPKLAIMGPGHIEAAGKMVVVGTGETFSEIGGAGSSKSFDFLLAQSEVNVGLLYLPVGPTRPSVAGSQASDCRIRAADGVDGCVPDRVVQRHLNWFKGRSALRSCNRMFDRNVEFL